VCSRKPNRCTCICRTSVDKNVNNLVFAAKARGANRVTNQKWEGRIDEEEITVLRLNLGGLIETINVIDLSAEGAPGLGLSTAKFTRH
jgi:hypothetical protein